MIQQAEKTAQLILAKLQGVNAVGMPQSLERTLEQILGAVVPTGYGGIHISDGVAAQTIEGAAEKITGFDENGPSGGSVVPDHTNDIVTVSQAGAYLCMWQCSFITGLGAAMWTSFARVNGVESILSWQRNVPSAGGPGSASAFCILNLDIGDEVSAYIEHGAGANREFTLAAGQLMLHRVG